MFLKGAEMGGKYADIRVQVDTEFKYQFLEALLKKRISPSDFLRSAAAYLVSTGEMPFPLHREPLGRPMVRNKTSLEGPSARHQV
jgi:hypothetical protein